LAIFGVARFEEGFFGAGLAIARMAVASYRRKFNHNLLAGNRQTLVRLSVILPVFLCFRGLFDCTHSVFEVVFRLVIAIAHEYL